MKALRLGAGLVFAGLIATVIWQSGELKKIRKENEQLGAEMQASRLEAPDNGLAETDSLRKAQEASTLEIAKLRGELTRLRTAATELENLKARNSQLQAQNQQLRNAPPTPSPAPSAPAPGADTFSRESWAFAGYGSPEAALVSAIWAMREGNPRTYLESLSPEEQARMSQVWGNKPEAEVAAKHQSDVSKITSFKIMDRQNVSEEQVVMSVYISGVDRLEKVSMQKVGAEWKFAGFVRDAAQ